MITSGLRPPCMFYRGSHRVYDQEIGFGIAERTQRCQTASREFVPPWAEKAAGEQETGSPMRTWARVLEPSHFRQTHVSQKSFRAGFATTEIAEDFHRMSAATHRQHRIAEAAAHLFNRLLIIKTRLFKGTEGIGRENLGPFVAVVSRSIAARKYAGMSTTSGLPG